MFAYCPLIVDAATPINTYTQKIKADNIKNNENIGTIIVDGISPNASHPACMIDAAISNCFLIYII